ncbi:MAG: hypothetical protein U0800_25820 [Isosphaeraceae bacterium]
MSGRTPDGGPRRSRSIMPGVECLDGRILLSGGAAAAPADDGLGPYVNAASAVPSRLATHTRFVAPRTALNDYLTNLIDLDINAFRRQSAVRGVTAHSALAAEIYENPFVRSVLSNRDTYSLLGSPAVSDILNYTSGASATATDTVSYRLDPANVTLGTETSLVQVPPQGGFAGFFATVPTRNIRQLDNGLYQVAIPTAQVPDNAPPATQVTAAQTPLSQTFSSTGGLINAAIQTGNVREAPNAPSTVPGLRLMNAFANNNYFPNTQYRNIRKLFRLALERGLFTLGSSQQDQVTAAFQAFTDTVKELNDQGVFVPSVPPTSPTLPRGVLSGTVAISSGALRFIHTAAPNIEGLPLPTVGNFPGRIDVGVVFAKNGDYGLILTARGPLLSAPRTFTSVDKVAGDVRVETSNAKSLADLDGLYTDEGLTLGSITQGNLTNAVNNGNGVRRFAASVGYGAGFEFGTGLQYTQVIPLGNAYALIPSSPANR